MVPPGICRDCGHRLSRYRRADDPLCWLCGQQAAERAHQERLDQLAATKAQKAARALGRTARLRAQAATARAARAKWRTGQNS